MTVGKDDISTMTGLRTEADQAASGAPLPRESAVSVSMQPSASTDSEMPAAENSPGGVLDDVNDAGPLAPIASSEPALEHPESFAETASPARTHQERVIACAEHYRSRGWPVVRLKAQEGDANSAGKAAFDRGWQES